MKIALITDTHWGIRNDNSAFLDNNKRFLDDVFFPHLVENRIDTVVHLGDLVDRRKYTNTYTAYRLRNDFLEPLANGGYNVHLITGNHDTYFKNTNKVNALRELVQLYPFQIYDGAAQEVIFDGTKILFVPWICEDNKKETLDILEKTNANIVMGHLEIAGFEMYRGSIVSHGDDRSLFSNFDLVFSGHYHHRSSDGTIFYLGSHAEFTWSDYDDPKGFHIFDTETREIKFIENPYKMFAKVWYDDETIGKEPEGYDLECFKGKIVKVIVSNKNDLYRFDKFIEALEEVGLIDLQIVEDHLNLSLENDDEIINEAESTLSIFKKYIDTFDSKTINKIKLENKIVELYNEALAVE